MIWKILVQSNLYEINKRGEVRNRLTKHILKKMLYNNGYFFVKISVNKKSKHFSIHRLLATNFIPNPKKLPQVNHKDGNKQNNSLNNLEWCTPSQNALHAFKNSLKISVKGSDCGRSKLSNEDVIEIRRLFKNNVMRTIIAKKFDISRTHVYFIALKYSWKHIK